MSAKKKAKTQPAFWTAFMINLHYDTSNYLHKIKYPSRKEPLLGLLVSRNPKKTHADWSIPYLFLLWKEMAHKPSKVKQLQKTFFWKHTQLHNLIWYFFYSLWQLEGIIFTKVCCYPEILFNHRVPAFFEAGNLKEVCLLFFISTILITKKLKYNANTKIPKWSSHISYLFIFLYYFYFLMRTDFFKNEIFFQNF